MGTVFNSWLRDLVVSCRGLRQRPGFTVVAVVSLAFGIGANALVFSVVNGVLLRPLALPGADRLVVVWLTPPNKPDQRFGASTGVFFTIRDHNTSFESFGTGRLNGAINVIPSGGGAAQRIPTQFFSRDLIRTLGVKPLLGDWPPKDPNGICISYGLWQRMFGGSPSVLGTTLNLGRVGLVIDAVMPQGFHLMNPDTGVWIYQPDTDLARTARSPTHLFSMIGRLKPGVTIHQAQAEMDGLAQVIGKKYPWYMGWGLKVESLRHAYVGGFRRLLWVFQGAVFFVLLIACSNVGALVLSRAAARRKELAVRSALGSSRWRLVRQLLTDNLLFSLLGAALGIGLAWVGVHVLVASGIEGFPRLDRVSMNWRVVAFAGLTALGTAIVFGVLPGLYMSRPNLTEVLREASWGSSHGVGQQRFRKAFVVGQVALAVVILVAATLLLRSFALISEARVGFNPSNLTVLDLPFPRGYYRRDGRTRTGEPLVQFDSRFDEKTEAVLRRLSTLPGVRSVAATETPPLGESAQRVGVRLEGEGLLPSEQTARSAEWYPVSTDYFRTLEIPLVRGRAFDTRDRLKSRPVAIINRAMAERFWPGENPIGQRFQTDVIDAPVREVVGVVGDVRQDRYQPVPQPQMYIPRRQVPPRMGNTMALHFLQTEVVVRTSGALTGMNASLRAAVHEVAPSVPVSKIRKVEDYAAGQIRDLRRATLLLSTFGIIAVALALIGIFGVVSHLVSQRRTELGIRIAVGAQGRNVQLLVLRQGVAMMILGLVLGTGAALVLTRVAGALLYGVSATDPLSFAAALLLLTAAGLLACYCPARRASRIEPAIALRSD